MNYRHAYHAGNHADVLKHVVVSRILVHLRKKDKPFRALDLHAGIGIYDLASEEAEKTGEWQNGVGRLYGPDGTPHPLSAPAEALLGPWRESIAAINDGGLTHYPGSPELIRHLLRPQDRLIVNELHPADADALASRYARERHILVTRLDAAIAIRSQLPPPERRGLVLIDPPYEQTDEVARVTGMLADGLRRFATGIYCIWYPVTGDGLDLRLGDAIATMMLPPVLHAELNVRRRKTEGGLSGSGVFVINPPWQLDRDLSFLLPELAEALRQDEGCCALVKLLPPR
jgi:23S rRNA (adenine2030-N6)-methyltransferase